MAFTVPKERYQQYTDKQGRNYVACYPQDMDLEPWFQDMIDVYGLPRLAAMFPYQTLVINQETGLLEPWQPCQYNAKVTNAFHLLLAQQMDAMMTPSPIDGEEFRLKLADAYPEKDEPEVRDVSPPSPSDFVASKEDGIGLDLENMPETIQLEAVKGWHPNKDANGNYMSAQQYSTNWWAPYPGGFNYNLSNTYLPQYRTANQYPF